MDGISLINPGGSLGSDNFKVSLPNDLRDLKNELIQFHGYDSMNNLFFKEYIKGKNLAELGCGHGFMTLLLAEFAKEVQAFDVDQKAIEFANRLKEKFNLNNIRFDHFRGNNFPVPEEQFDVVISADVIEHVRDPLSYLKEAYRVLKKDGLLLLTTPNGLIARKNKCIIQSHSKFHITEYYPSELSELLVRSNFDLIESFSSKNISGSGYQINGVRKFAIKLLCKIRLYSIISKVKNTFFAGRNINLKPQNNTIDDFNVNKAKLSEINDKNCDVIFVVARK